MSDIDDTLREELSALLDGALPEERATELRRRLESDAALRKEYEELRRTVAAVRALPRSSVPAGFRARLERKLMAPPAAGIRRLRFRLAVAAVVTVAVGAGVLALRPSGPDTSAYEEARQQESLRDALRTTSKQPPSKPEGLGKVDKRTEAETADAPSEVDDMRRRPLREPPVAGPPAPETPTEDRGASRKEVVPAPRAKAKQGAKAEEVKRDVRTLLGRRGGERGDVGDAEQATASALLEYAARARVASETRMPYLFQLNQLSATKVEAHLNEVKVTWGAMYDMAATLPPSANLTVTNLDEAKQIFTVLHKFPGTAGRGVASAFVLPGNAGKTPLLTAEVEVTPQQWQSVGTWLQLMNVADRKRAPITVQEGRRSKKKARPDEEMEEEKRSLEPADRDAKRKVKIYIRYPQAEAPAAAAGKK
ncbi:MAG: hypothetical protein ACYS0K_19075 [Planctomycetota bacterium]